MNTVSSYKKLPLVGAVLLALAVFPGASMAEKGDGYGDRGRYDKHSSYERKKSYNGHNQRGNSYQGKHNSNHGNKHASKSHGYDKHRKHDKHWKGKQYGHHKSHAYNKHKHHNKHKRRDYGHSHSHTSYVVNDYGHRPHYSGYDDLRFMIGLHNPNLDIVFRN